MTILKGGIDGFNYFSLISVILFSNQDHLCDTLIQTVSLLINVTYFDPTINATER
jgi:hypothetical protein